MFLSLFFPVLSNIYLQLSTALTNYENHRTEQGYENAFTQKNFILTFFNSYMSIILTAYVYGSSPKVLLTIVPFGRQFLPLKLFNSIAIDSVRLKQQVIYFAVAGQIFQAIEEYFGPYIKRKFFSEARRITHTSDETITAFDSEEERPFLEKVRKDLELPEYEIYEDYEEMIIQVYLDECG